MVQKVKFLPREGKRHVLQKKNVEEIYFGNFVANDSLVFIKEKRTARVPNLTKKERKQIKKVGKK